LLIYINLSGAIAAARGIAATNRYGNNRSDVESNSGRFSRYLILVGNFQIDPIFKTFLMAFWGFRKPQHFSTLSRFSPTPRNKLFYLPIGKRYLEIFSLFLHCFFLPVFFCFMVFLVLRFFICSSVLFFGVLIYEGFMIFECHI
jgi:hypothetical protein